jgi:CBS domain containing-hemolysin-like protein
VFRDTRFSRYPLVQREGGEPVGVVHVKSLFGIDGPISAEQLRGPARPCFYVPEQTAAGGNARPFPRAFRSDGDRAK